MQKIFCPNYTFCVTYKPLKRVNLPIKLGQNVLVPRCPLLRGSTVLLRPFCRYHLNAICFNLFLLLDSMTESSDILFTFHSSPRPVHEMISGIGFLPSLHRHTRNGSKITPSTGDDYHVSHDLLEGGVEGRYISVCQDASLFIWKNNLTLQRTISVNF